MRSATRSLLLITALAIVVALSLIAFCWRPIDGIDGAFLSLVFSDDTFCARDYTDEGFRAARVGMTRSQVYKLLGPPLGTSNYEHGEIAEQWTCSHQDNNFKRRELIFRRDQVVEKIAEFYLD